MQKSGDNSQIFTFTHAAPELNQQIKSIVQPRKVRRYSYPHGPELFPGNFAVTSEHLPLENAAFCAPVPPELEIQVNHYFLRSREDYEAKAMLKKAMKRRFEMLSLEDDLRRYPVPNTELAEFYSGFKDTPIPPWQEPERPASPQAMLERSAPLLERGRLLELEEYLCEASLVLPDDPMIWMIRSVASRKEGNCRRALHCIREALKFSGTHILYEELEAVYRGLDDVPRAEQAGRQAEFRKWWFNTLCHGQPAQE